MHDKVNVIIIILIIFFSIIRDYFYLYGLHLVNFMSYAIITNKMKLDLVTTSLSIEFTIIIKISFKNVTLNISQ